MQKKHRALFFISLAIVAGVFYCFYDYKKSLLAEATSDEISLKSAWTDFEKLLLLQGSLLENINLSLKSPNISKYNEELASISHLTVINLKIVSLNHLRELARKIDQEVEGGGQKTEEYEKIKAGLGLKAKIFNDAALKYNVHFQTWLGKKIMEHYKFKRSALIEGADAEDNSR